MATRLLSVSRAATRAATRGLAGGQGEGGLAAAALSGDGQKLQLTWGDGQKSEFASCWLKENCPSPAITDPASHGRLLLMADLQLEQRMERLRLGSTSVTVEWAGGGESTYTGPWLRARAWPGPGAGHRSRQLWTGAPEPKVHRFPRVLGEEGAQLDWLQDLRSHGLTVLEETPCTPDSLRELVRKVGTTKSTHFGAFFNVITKSEPMNLAYTSATLGLHLDLPFYDYTPGVQLLQCVRQHPGPGGANHFADAFAVAERMRSQHPEEFQLLSSVEVHFWDAGCLDDDSLAGGVSGSARPFHKRHSAPTFRLGPTGELRQVSFNNQVRSSQPSGDADETRRLIKALHLFNQLCYSPDHLVTYKMRDGDMVVFDNLRVMHGREGFTVGKGEEGGRHLFGCYIDWDEIWDRLHVLTGADLI